VTTFADLPLHVNRGDTEPMAAQIASQIRYAVSGGVLGGGERMPSSRELARLLGVSRTVVMGAYMQLFAEGWLEGRHGSGTYVAAGTHATASATGSPAPQAPPERRDEPVIELAPGIPWAAGIDQGIWRRALRYAGTQPPSAWPDPAGLPDLRAEVTTYMRRTRGLAASTAEVLITRGVAAGLALLVAGIVKPGDRVGVEDPGYPSARQVLTRAGAIVVPCPVDSRGIIPGKLPGNLKLVYTTPAHQYPLGGRLPVARRQALTAWARATGALIVEDDYDSEFRYDVAPLPTMRGMDPDVVVYLGTTSKMLTPALGWGWLIAPPALVAELAGIRRELGDRVPEPVQHAVLSMLRTGDLERHVRKMRLEYARRRAAVVDALSAASAGTGAAMAGSGAPAGAGPLVWRLLGDTAGMHVVVELPDAATAERVRLEAESQRVVIGTPDRYFVGPATRHGLLIGYGATPLPKLREAVTVLRDVLSAR